MSIVMPATIVSIHLEDIPLRETSKYEGKTFFEPVNFYHLLERLLCASHWLTGFTTILSDNFHSTSME